jgi:predicted Zn-dependent protease
VTIAHEYIQRKDFQSALPYAQKAAELEPRSFPALTVFGRVLVEGDLDSKHGIQELEAARKLAPGSPQVRIALATAYAKVGRKEDAARERREFLKLRQEVDAAEKNSSR